MQFLETIAHLFHPRRSNNHRPHILHPEGFFVLTMIAIIFSAMLRFSGNFLSETGQVLGFSSSINADQVVTQTNQQRAKEGLGALGVNSQLNQAALAKAQYMMDHQFWAHTAPDGTEPWKFFRDVGYHYRVAGENLARDFSNTNDMVAAWMASPTHRANIMNPQYRDTGVAVLNGNLLGTDTTLVVQLFGDPQVHVAEITPAAPMTQVEAAEDTAPAASIQPSPEMTIEQQPSSQQKGPQVLASTVLPISSLAVPPLFSPLQLMKAFFLAIIVLIVMTLVYDGFVMRNQNTVRLVGKNLAHILLFTVIAFLLIFFKGGIVK